MADDGGSGDARGASIRGQRPDSAGPLSDLRVLDLAGESGVFAGRLLADLGADVIRIEPPAGSAVRRRRPFLDDVEGPERSLYHLHFNLNKRGVTLDIRSDEGAAVFRRLAGVSDALIETEMLGAMDRLGLGFDALRQVNPRLLYATITPFGQTGSLAGYAANDLVGVATSGLMFLNGFPEDPPNQPGGEQAYHMASLAVASGILIALTGRDRHATPGRRIDVSLQEAASMATLQTANASFYRWFRNVPARRGYGLMARSIYQCADGLWVSFFAPPPARWPALVRWLEEEGVESELTGPEWQEPMARYKKPQAISAAVQALVSRYTRSDLFHEGQKRKLMVMPVNNVAELVEDPQLQARGFLAEYEHPALSRTLVDAGPAAVMTATPLSVRRPAPTLGQHNDEVYLDLLRMHADELRELRSKGVI